MGLGENFLVPFFKKGKITTCLCVMERAGRSRKRKVNGKGQLPELRPNRREMMGCSTQAKRLAFGKKMLSLSLLRGKRQRSRGPSVSRKDCFQEPLRESSAHGGCKSLTRPNPATFDPQLVNAQMWTLQIWTANYI